MLGPSPLREYLPRRYSEGHEFDKVNEVKPESSSGDSRYQPLEEEAGHLLEVQGYVGQVIAPVPFLLDLRNEGF